MSDDPNPTSEELAYEMYEALTDPFDVAVLDQQLAEGQPVEDELRERQHEMENLRPLLVPERDQVADAGAGPAGGEVRITEAEWQALYLASRALHEVGAGLTRSGAADLAAESYLSAATLEGLGRRAVVEPARDPQRPAEREAER